MFSSKILQISGKFSFETRGPIGILKQLSENRSALGNFFAEYPYLVL